MRMKAAAIRKASGATGFPLQAHYLSVCACVQADDSQQCRLFGGLSVHVCRLMVAEKFQARWNPHGPCLAAGSASRSRNALHHLNRNFKLNGLSMHVCRLMAAAMQRLFRRLSVHVCRLMVAASALEHIQAGMRMVLAF